MSDVKRATVYFDVEIHRALKLKAAVNDRTISDLVNDAVRLALVEDSEDIHAFEDRATDSVLDFEEFVANLDSPLQSTRPECRRARCAS